MKKYDYDLIIIGSGAGGSVGAHWAASQLHKKVAIIEKDKIGGECPNIACVPTKALLHAAKVFDTVNTAATYGASTGRVELDFNKVHQWKNLVVERTGTSHGEESLKKSGINVIGGQARFISNHEIAIGPNKRLTAEKFIIATGSSVFIPPIQGLIDVGYLTFKEAVDLRELPESIFILGGGPIGCEFAQIFQSFGVKVHIADMAPRLLAKDDEEVSSLIQALFENRGTTVYTQSTVTSITKKDGKKVVHFKHKEKENSVSVSEILIASGKKPNTDLDLERAGVSFSKQGIRVNRYLQTTSSNIFAAGDVVGPYLFTHTGSYQSHIAAQNAFRYKKIAQDFSIVPRATYTNPEVASVGLNEEDAIQKFGSIKRGIAPMASLGRANTDNALDGFVKIITTRDEKIIGASIVGPHAGELIHEIALAMKFRARAFDVASMIHAYPTYSEAIKLACGSLE